MLFFGAQEIGFANEKLIVGIENQPYMPHFAFENDQLIGFTRDLLDRFFEQQNIEVEYRAYPVKRLFRSLLDGEIDFKYPDNPQWQAQVKKESGKTIFYSDQIAKYIDGTMVIPANRDLTLDHFKFVGTIRGFTPWPYLELINKKDVTLVENSSLSGLIKQTIMGRVQGAYFNIEVANYELKKMNLKNSLVLNKNLPYSSDYYYLSTALHPKLLKKLDIFLSKNKEMRVALKKKYYIETSE